MIESLYNGPGEGAGTPKQRPGMCGTSISNMEIINIHFCIHHI